MTPTAIRIGGMYGQWSVLGPASVSGAPPAAGIVAMAARWLRTLVGAPAEQEVPGTLVACPLASARRGVLHDEERERRFSGFPDLRHPALPRLVSSMRADGMVIDVWDLPAARPLGVRPVGTAVALKRVEALCDALAPMHAHGAVHGELGGDAVGEQSDGRLTLLPHLAWRPRGLVAGRSGDEAPAAPSDDVEMVGALLAAWMGLPPPPSAGRPPQPLPSAGLDGDVERWLAAQADRVPDALRALLAAALAADPRRRPPDAGALLDRVRAALVDLGLSPQPLTLLVPWRVPSGPSPGCLVPWPTLRSTVYAEDAGHVAPASAAAAIPGPPAAPPAAASDDDPAPASLSGGPTTASAAPPAPEDTLWVASGGLLSHESNRLLLAMVKRRLLPFAERYRIAADLGGGGMGSIVRADDLVLERAVVMKRLHQHIAADDRLAEQFLKEVRVMARFDHPHLIRVFDLGIDDDGRLYYSMPFIDGAHLGETLRRIDAASSTTLVDYPFRNLARLVARIADGLASAHAVGVLHCDLKPANVMVGRSGEVVIIDWGLAVLESSPEVQARFASLYRAEIGSGDGGGHATVAIGLPDRQITGTPSYMAPEQAAGSGVDRRTDVYGLGGILYASLCGQAPNEGGSLMEIIGRLAARTPVRPPGQRLGERQRIVPPRLEAIALRCLDPDPQRRYPSAAAVRNDLRRWLHETASEAASDD